MCVQKKLFRNLDLEIYKTVFSSLFYVSADFVSYLKGRMRMFVSTVITRTFCPEREEAT
jgi:hypothetical protein